MIGRLDAEQLSALLEIQAAFAPDAVVLIGATALRLRLRDFTRTTLDLDATVSVGFAVAAERLRNRPGWNRHPRLEHQWTSPGAIRVDVLPVDAEALARGFIVWPESGIRMSVAGFRHVFSRATRLHEGRHSIRVADLATLALLKVVSYLDRPQDRQRDLGDIAHIWEGYLPEDDTRRFDAGALEAGIPFDAETSFLLGRDLGGMVNENEAGAVESLLRSLADDTPARAQILSDSPLSWRRNEDELELRLRAFGLGFADGRRRLSEDTE